MAFECFATARYCGNNHTSFDLDLLPSCFTITISIDSMHDYRAIARDVTTTPLRHFGAQPDFAVYGWDGELCCC